MKRAFLLLIKNICEYVHSNLEDEFSRGTTDMLSVDFIELHNNITDSMRNKYIDKTGDIAGSLKYGYIQSRQWFWEEKNNQRGKIGNACSIVISKMLFFVIFIIYSLVIVISIFRNDSEQVGDCIP